MLGLLLSSDIKCTVTQKIWLTPSVFTVRFRPSKPFEYEPGQFVSVTIPDHFVRGLDGRRVRRLYSLNCSLEQGYELCIKQTGGPGPSYLATLEEGDSMEISGPHGEFKLKAAPGRSICFIATGTGIAPLRSMMLSHTLRELRPQKVTVIFGAKDESELLFQEECRFLGFQYIAALSSPKYPGLDPHHFRGRITEYLESLPASTNWKDTDFYLCGNGAMVAAVTTLLERHHKITAEQIEAESYFANKQSNPTKIAQTQWMSSNLKKAA